MSILALPFISSAAVGVAIKLGANTPIALVTVALASASTALTLAQVL